MKKKTPERDIPNTNEIQAYLHCGFCVAEYQRLRDADDPSVDGESPKSFARIQAGWTPLGIQVWCNRCEANIVHIDFQGVQHPANVTAPKR